MSKTDTPTQAWRNRIAGHAEILATDLKANPRNWRTHPDAQTGALNGVLVDVGWVQSVIVNQRSGFIVDGHARVKMAAERGESVPVVYVDLSDEEEALILASLDPLSAMAGVDPDLLASLLAEAQTSNTEVQAVLEELAKQATSPAASPESPDEFSEYDENIETEHSCPKCGYQWSGGK